jgi:hypothetical protein
MPYHGEMQQMCMDMYSLIENGRTRKTKISFVPLIFVSNAQTNNIITIEDFELTGKGLYMAECECLKLGFKFLKSKKYCGTNYGHIGVSLQLLQIACINKCFNSFFPVKTLFAHQKLSREYFLHFSSLGNRAFGIVTPIKQCDLPFIRIL